MRGKLMETAKKFPITILSPGEKPFEIYVYAVPRQGDIIILNDGTDWYFEVNSIRHLVTSGARAAHLIGVYCTRRVGELYTWKIK